MTVTEVAELCRRQYYGGTPSNDAGFRLPDFIKAVEQARAYKIRYDYFTTSRFEGQRTINVLWLQAYSNVPVLFDELTNTYYSNLPAEVVDLPHQLGLYHVSPQKNYQNPFKIQTIGESWLFMSNPQDYVCFHYDSDKIYYDNFDPDIKEVYIQMIPLTDVQIPDEFTMEITDLVMNRFLKNKQGGVLEDKLTNTNANQEEVNG